MCCDFQKEGLGTVSGVIARNARLQLERIVLHSTAYCWSISLIPNYVDEPSWKHTLKWRFNIALPPTGIVGALDGTALDDLGSCQLGELHIFCPNRIASGLDSQNIQNGRAKRLKILLSTKNSKTWETFGAIWSHLIGLAPSYPCHITYGIQVQKDLRTRYLVLRNSLSNSLKHLDRSC